MTKRKLNDADRQAVRDLRQQGWTNKALSEQFDVSEQTIIRICRPDLYEKNLESNKLYQARNAKQIYKTRKKNDRTYTFKFHKVNDADIIEHLEKQGSVQGYVRSLITDDMKK